MHTLEEVTLELKHASDIFITVVSTPDDNELSTMDASLISILMQIVKFDATTNVHKLFGVVATDEDYLATTGQAAIFAVPAIISIYYNTIPANTTATCRRLEAAQVANINDRYLYEVASAEC